jgi:hypothetical protein
MVNVELLQKITQQQREAATVLAGDLTRGVQSVAVAHADFNQRALKEATAFFAKLSNVKSFEGAFELYSQYNKEAYETLLMQSQKITEAYADLARHSFKPIDKLIPNTPASA